MHQSLPLLGLLKTDLRDVKGAREGSNGDNKGGCVSIPSDDASTCQSPIEVSSTAFVHPSYEIYVCGDLRVYISGILFIQAIVTLTVESCL